MADERTVECDRCEGRGLHDCLGCSGLGHDNEGDECRECNGHETVDCQKCNTTGYINESEIDK